MAVWGQLTTSATPTGRIPACTPFELPSGGAIVFNDSYTSTLTAKLTFHEPCDDPSNPPISYPGATGNSTVIGNPEPFYASTSPQIFAIATATVISYLLVIIIFITPRTFFVGGLGGASSAGFLGRSTNTSVIGVGRRPWLQKIATVTVAISLTVATADTFRVAQEQYDVGYTDASLLVLKVVGSVEIRVVRVISDTFLWLAQVQTLIRLFPRHKEKVTIKWLGFALVSLDTIFSILDNFLNESVGTRPRNFKDAIPALNYLFELAISLMYASCVIYYSLSKRRFAFWHKRMRNICLVAFLSLVAVLVPVVFFVLDVSKPDVAGWGDYIRWVGAAAASVVVWEWVERIEALERDERKDGILGREIFDGDEMLDGPEAEEAELSGRRTYWNRNDFPSDAPAQDGSGTGGTRMRTLRSRIPFGTRLRREGAKIAANSNLESSGTAMVGESTGQVAMPAQAASPVSRSDTTSAGSTIYAIRYHTVNTPAMQDLDVTTGCVPQPEVVNLTQPVSDPTSSETAVESAAETTVKITEKDEIPIVSGNPNPSQRNEKSDARSTPIWRTVANPFKRRRASPPAEIAAQIADSGARRSPAERTIALRERFASARRTRAGNNGPRGAADNTTVAVTIIPAQRRRHPPWSLDQNGEQDPKKDNEVQEQAYSDQQRQTPNPRFRPPTTSPFYGADDQEMPVLVIPAPRRGQRTWSPGDAYTGPVSQSPVSSPAPDPEPPPDAAAAAASTRSPVISMRGTLMISEDQARGLPGPSRRSTYSYSRSTPSAPRATAAAPLTASSPALDRAVKREREQEPAGTSAVHDATTERAHDNRTRDG